MSMMASKFHAWAREISEPLAARLRRSNANPALGRDVARVLSVLGEDVATVDDTALRDAIGRVRAHGDAHMRDDAEWEIGPEDVSGLLELAMVG